METARARAACFSWLGSEPGSKENQCMISEPGWAARGDEIPDDPDEETQLSDPGQKTKKAAAMSLAAAVQGDGLY